MKHTSQSRFNNVKITDVGKEIRGSRCIWVLTLLLKVSTVDRGSTTLLDAIGLDFNCNQVLGASVEGIAVLMRAHF